MLLEAICVYNKVIIGLPAYNEGAVLPQILQSIGALRESWAPNLEALVVNDGSTDNTLETLESYARNAVLSNMSPMRRIRAWERPLRPYLIVF